VSLSSCPRLTTTVCTISSRQTYCKQIKKANILGTAASPPAAVVPPHATTRPSTRGARCREEDLTTGKRSSLPQMWCCRARGDEEEADAVWSLSAPCSTRQILHRVPSLEPRKRRPPPPPLASPQNTTTRPLGRRGRHRSCCHTRLEMICTGG
jgi:hypothetical protein